MADHNANTHSYMCVFFFTTTSSSSSFGFKIKIWKGWARLRKTQKHIIAQAHELDRNQNKSNERCSILYLHSHQNQLNSFYDPYTQCDASWLCYLYAYRPYSTLPLSFLCTVSPFLFLALCLPFFFFMRPSLPYMSCVSCICCDFDWCMNTILIFFLSQFLSVCVSAFLFLDFPGCVPFSYIQIS